MALIRKTYGFHKPMDKIADKQIVRMTGINRQNVNKVKNRLIERNIVIFRNYKIGINPNYTKWKRGFKWNRKRKFLLSQQITKKKKDINVISRDIDVISGDTNVISPNAHKRNTTKETIQKKRGSSFKKSSFKRKKKKPYFSCSLLNGKKN